jgi:hypothetical protein
VLGVPNIVNILKTTGLNTSNIVKIVNFMLWELYFDIVEIASICLSLFCVGGNYTKIKLELSLM